MKEKRGLLEVEDLSVTLYEKGKAIPAVRGVSLQVPKGGCLGIIGESGCGKSLTCHAVMGLLEQGKWSASGTISFDGRPVSAADTAALAAFRGRQIGLIMQNPMSCFDPRRTIGAHFLEGIPRRVRDQRKKEAADLLQRMAFSEPENILASYPFQLSGGMLQRVLIALVLCEHPQLLIADEPTTALDNTVRQEIILLLKRLGREEGIAVMLVSHDLHVITAMADVAAVMYAGQVIEYGPLQAVLKRPLHPYTRLLIQARPAFSKERLHTMAGRPPGLGEIPKEGCAFAARCPSCQEICRYGTQELREAENGHYSRCQMDAEAYSWQQTAGG